MNAAEMRHRLANLFQLLSTLTRMRIQRSTDPESRRQLTWMLESISALGMLQQRLIQPTGGDFADYLTDMLPQWRRRCAGRPVQVELVTTSLFVREQLASALAVITNELVTNAIAHAHPDGRAGAVRIELAALPDGGGALTVSDDGVGYEAAPDDRSKLGLWLIRGLSDQVKGVMTTTTTDGVKARLEFPTGQVG